MQNHYHYHSMHLPFWIIFDFNWQCSQSQLPMVSVAYKDNSVPFFIGYSVTAFVCFNVWCSDNFRKAWCIVNVDNGRANLSCFASAQRRELHFVLEHVELWNKHVIVWRIITCYWKLHCIVQRIIPCNCSKNNYMSLNV